MNNGYDVIVVGAGNAALCAALSAQEGGARVLVLEKAPLDERGGNSLFTAGGFRFVHDGIEDLRKDVLTDLSQAEIDQIVIPKLPKQQYMDDLMRVTEDECDEELAEILIGRSRETIVWMRSHGVRFIPMFGRQSYKVDGKHHFYGGVNIEAVGGGFGLVESLIKRAEKLGIEIRYATEMRELLQNQRGAVTGVRVKGPEGYQDIAAKAVVLACGGFEANPEMRTRYFGPGWELCRVRGTRHNTGGGIRAALGHRRAALWRLVHVPRRAVGHQLSAVRRPCRAGQLPEALLSDRHRREPQRRALHRRGRRLSQSHLCEVRSRGDEAAAPHCGPDLRCEDRSTWCATNTASNRSRSSRPTASRNWPKGWTSIRKDSCARSTNSMPRASPGNYNPSVLDGVRTEGIEPPKSNWALPIDKPPFTGFVVTCGITFTFGGLRIDNGAAVLDTGGQRIPGLFAAGELVGGIFYGNYLGGAGLMSGSVFGRQAGKSASEFARAKAAAA